MIDLDARLLDTRLLDARLLDAHARTATDELVGLYTRAADEALDVDSRCFYLTHAYVFALEVGHVSTPALRAHLEHHGRI